MGAKSDNYALSGLNYAHKLRIIKAKMTQNHHFCYIGMSCTVGKDFLN